MKRLILIILISVLSLSACAKVDLNAPLPVFDTGIDMNAWVTIPAGPFLRGQHNENASIDYDYEIKITLVTVSQYAEYLNAALEAGVVNLEEEMITGFYPGDEFHGYKHEERIDPGDWILIPLNDPALRLILNGTSFTPQTGYENHPMTLVSWFGARAYCEFYDGRLPTEDEWEKAARGTEDDRPYPWGYEIKHENANFYTSRDPFEDMWSYGSRTTPVGFYNGKTYVLYTTLDSPSPYGLYDMAGNVWEWTGDVYDKQHYRYMRGGSKDVYDSELRIWSSNNATPTYISPGVGFRCVK